MSSAAVVIGALKVNGIILANFKLGNSCSYICPVIQLLCMLKLNHLPKPVAVRLRKARALSPRLSVVVLILMANLTQG